MSESSGKRRKEYVDNPRDISKHTCITHGPGNSSGECKGLGYFGYKYSKISPTKDCGHDPSTKNNITDSKRTIIFLIMQG